MEEVKSNIGTESWDRCTYNGYYNFCTCSHSLCWADSNYSGNYSYYSCNSRTFPGFKKQLTAGNFACGIDNCCSCYIDLIFPDICCGQDRS